MIAPQKIEIKQGDGFRIRPSSLLDDAGAVVSLAGYTIASQVRTGAGVLVADLTITITGDEFESDVEDTALWPLEDLESDIRLTLAGVPIHSETFIIRIYKAVTV